MLSAIMAAITAIPKAIDLLQGLLTRFDALVAAIKQQQEDKWIKDHRDLIFKVIRAQNDAERFVLLRELVKLRDTLP